MESNGNLKPFKPGQSGNPKGRQKGSKNVRTVLQKLVDQEITDEATGEAHTALEAMLMGAGCQGGARRPEGRC